MLSRPETCASQDKLKENFVWGRKFGYEYSEVTNSSTEAKRKERAGVRSTINFVKYL